MMEMPKHAVLDGDIIAWKIAFVADAEGSMAIDSLLGRAISKWTPKKTTHTTVALSGEKLKNFRRKEFPGYKSNRAAVYKPDALPEVFDAIRSNYETMTKIELEADDLLGIYSSSGDGVAVTIDKDLRGVPGWHWNPDKEKKPVHITEEEAHRWFCIQWMAGDSTDGIPGLWKIGIKKATKLLDEWDREEWHDNIAEMYTEEKFAPKNKFNLDDMSIAMARCVKILDHKQYDLETDEIKLWKP